MSSVKVMQKKYLDSDKVDIFPKQSCSASMLVTLKQTLGGLPGAFLRQKLLQFQDALKSNRVPFNPGVLELSREM